MLNCLRWKKPGVIQIIKDHHFYQSKIRSHPTEKYRGHNIIFIKAFEIHLRK